MLAEEMGQVVNLHQGIDVQEDGREDGRLTELLRALATAPAYPDDQPREDGLTAILRRIGATVLPRDIAVMARGREVARLLISNRRLLRVTVPGGGAPASEPTDPEAAATAFAALLRRHLPADAPALRIARPPVGVGMPDLGCDCDQLSRALGVSPPARAPVARGFDERVQGLAAAWLRQHRDGRVLARGGDAHAALLDEVLARADWPSTGEAAQCLLLPGPAGIDLSISGTADERLICLTPAASRPRLFAAWAVCHGAG